MQDKKDIPANFKQITGWNTLEEANAYDKGREHEQAVILKYIEQWDGHTNSHLGDLLKRKMIELKDKF